MNDITLTKEQFENEAFKHWIRIGKMHNYDDYQNWIAMEGLKSEQDILQEEYLNEGLEEITPQEDVQQKKKAKQKNDLDTLDIPDSSGGDEDEESEDDEGGENYTEEELNNAVRQAVDDYFSEKQFGVNHAEEVKSWQTKVDDLTAKDSNFAIEKSKTYAVWSGGSCDGCQALNGTVYEVGFGMMDIPETHLNCQCELTILDANLLPTKETIPLKKWAKDQKKPKPSGMIDLRKVTFPNNDTEGRKLGQEGDKQNKNWDDMTKAEKEKAKQKELDKFMKSDKLKKNVDQTKWYSMVNWVNNVRPGGEWDYKQGGKRPEMEHVGNFNYGATGRALGIPPSVLKGAGGVVQIAQGTSDWDFYDSYFDDPVDQKYIQQGIDWYDENYGKSSSSYNWNYGEYDANSGNIDWDFYE